MMLFCGFLFAHDIEDQCRFSEPKEQFDLLYKLSAQLYYSDCEKSIEYGLSALEQANLIDDTNLKLIAYYNLATAYAICGSYKEAGTYLNLFKNKLRANNLLYSEFIQSNQISDEETKFHIMQTQLDEILRKEEINHLAFTNKDLLIANQRNIQRYYLIILGLIILFTLIIYRQWQQVKKTNIRLNETVQELNSANFKLEQIARTDPLTKLSNRRDMLEKTDQEKRRFGRNGKPFVVILADIDGFKGINDKFGHEAGDFVLQSISHLMQSSIRKQDIVGRWGGEEFLFILPETDLDGGYLLAEKIRKNTAFAPFHYQSEIIFITITLGVSVYNKLTSVDECIRRSDKALYEGKKRGKNCVVVARPDNDELYLDFAATNKIDSNE